jgi:hypothetical protein
VVDPGCERVDVVADDGVVPRTEPPLDGAPVDAVGPFAAGAAVVEAPGVK